MIIRKMSIILVVANAAAAFLKSAGVRAAWGMATQTGIDAQAEAANSSAQNVSSGPVGLIDAIGGATIAAIDVVASIVGVIFAAPILLLNLGTPEFIVTFAFAPLYVAAAWDFVSLLRGMNIQ